MNSYNKTSTRRRRKRRRRHKTARVSPEEWYKSQLASLETRQKREISEIEASVAALQRKQDSVLASPTWWDSISDGLLAGFLTIPAAYIFRIVAALALRLLLYIVALGLDLAEGLLHITGWQWIWELDQEVITKGLRLLYPSEGFLDSFVIYLSAMVALGVSLSSRFSYLFRRCPHGVFGGDTARKCGDCIASAAIQLRADEHVNQEKLKTAREDFSKAELELETEYQSKLKADRLKQESLKTLEGLRKLDSYEFEIFVAELYAKLGYENVSVTPESNDQGVDILGQRNGASYGFQCKRYGPNTTVGGPEVQGFFGAATQADCEYKVFVTTGSFTSGARDAAEKLKIELVDGKSLCTLVNSVP